MSRKGDFVGLRGFNFLIIGSIFSQSLWSAVNIDASRSDLATSSNVTSCSAVKLIFEKHGYDGVPTLMIPGAHLQICHRDFTCCTLEMESKLGLQSSDDFFKLLTDGIGSSKSQFSANTFKFDAFVLNAIEDSKSDLDTLFWKTYGTIYEENAPIFYDLFQDLRAYYNGSSVNLVDKFDGFFSLLLQRLFPLLNKQFVFSESFFSCTSEHMDRLLPFGGIPNKLKTEVSRAFMAARTFSQGLAMGRDVIHVLLKIEPSLSCQNAITRMLYCPICRGVLHDIPCHSYCLNTMTGCLTYQAQLNDAWVQYKDLMVKVAGRLEGPFSITSVIGTMGIKISEAIMTFQENAVEIASQVFQGCGKPDQHLPHDDIRRRRGIAVGASSSAVTSVQSKESSTANTTRTSATTSSMTKLEKKLLQDIRSKLEMSRDLWKLLAQSVCREIGTNSTSEKNCWNGTDQEITTNAGLDVAGTNTAKETNGHESLTQMTPRNIVERELLKLRLIANLLRNAYQGTDAEWIDTDDNFDGSGCEGGCGSGDGFANIKRNNESQVFENDRSSNRGAAGLNPLTRTSTFMLILVNLCKLNSIAVTSLFCRHC